MADVYDQLLDEQKPTTAPAAPAAPAKSKDAYDTILDEFSAQQDKALQQSLTQAMKVAPQQAATTQQLAKVSGLPEDVVERNKDVVQQQVKLREIQSLLAASPILARQMQDPAFAKLAHSDANTLSTIERLWRGTSSGINSGFGMGFAGIGDVIDIAQRNLSEGFARTFLPTPIGGWDKVDNASLAGPRLAEDWQTVGNFLKAQGRQLEIPQLQQTFFDKVLAGIGQVGSQLTVGALTGPVGSGAFLYGQGANAMTEKVQGDNASQGAKDLAVLSGAGVTALTEKWALDKLLGPMAVPIQNQVGAALARIGIAGASEGAQETIESISQDAIRQFLTNPDAPIQVGQAFEEGGVGATVGAIVRTVVEAAAGVRGRAMRADQNAAKAERDAQMIEQLNKLAAASELLQTSPETFQQFIESAAEDGDVQDVYIDAQFLMQSGIADQLAQVSPSVAQQLPTALATGGTVQIPVGEYATNIAPTEFAQGLLDHIKTDPQGFSRAEAQEYFQTQTQQLEQEIAQQLEAKTIDQSFVDSKERVKQTVLTELNNLGRFTPQKNEVDAALIAARTAVRAAQLGMTPEAFFEQQRLRFAAERIDGDSFNQNTVDRVDVPADYKVEPAAPLQLNPELFAGPNGLSSLSERERVAANLISRLNRSQDNVDLDDFSILLKQELQAAGLDAEYVDARDLLGDNFILSDEAPTGNLTPKDAAVLLEIESGLELLGWMSGNMRGQEVVGSTEIDNARTARTATNKGEALAAVRDQILAEANKQPTREQRGNVTGIRPGVLFQGGPTYVTDASQINVDQDLQDLASELLDNGAQITPDGRVRVFHRTSQAAADGIRKTGVMSGKEDGLFFSTKRDGQNTDYGDAVVELYIPLDKLQLDDVFGDEAHVRVPLQRAGQKLNVNQWLGEYNQFAGVNAKTAPRDQLFIAWDMESKGASAAQIQRETGWSKGVDGLWRFEISDDKAKFKKSDFSLDDLAAEVGSEIEIREDGDQYKAVYGRQASWAATPEEARQSLLYAIARRRDIPTFDIDKALKGELGGEVFVVADVLDHPELFEAYPDIKYLKVDFVKPEAGENGSYDPRTRTITLAANRDVDSMLSTLLHEIQHAIQTEERFASGGSVDPRFISEVKNAVSQLKEAKVNEAESWKRYNWRKLDDAEAASEMARNALKYQSAQRLIEYSNRDKPSGVFRLIRNEMQWIYGEQFYGNRQANDLQRMFYDLPKRGDKRNAFLRKMAWEGAQFILESIPADQRQSFKDDPRTLQSLIKALERQASKARKELAPLRELETEARNAQHLAEVTRFKGPYEVYRALAGEIEARATQARQKLTPEERRNRPMRMDSDIPLSEAIVIVGGVELQVPSVMQNTVGQAPRGAFNPNNNTIALLKNADLSTFLHEAGHYFFESDIALAAELVQKADTMTQGEQEILNDVSALFKWLGVNGTIDEQLAQWYGMSFEEKRAYHEKTAESFERYLFEGKAPSIELQSYFQQFRAWLVNVYKSIKDFIESNPAAGELSDEVRAVFDRMLASTEEIQLAEQARSMMPLFRTQADADNIGMTAEEFRAYQMQDVQATNDAIQDLQARAVRDLQWTRNAHNREVKRLQALANELRAEARIEARADVMSQPVYRAWQFLTGKAQVDEQAQAARKKAMDDWQAAREQVLTEARGKAKVDLWEASDEAKADYPDAKSRGMAKGQFLARMKKDIDLIVARAALDWDKQNPKPEAVQKTTTIEDMGELVNAKLSLDAVREMGFSKEEVELLKARRMTASDGLHPDLVAELPGIEMSSGDELVRKLLEATPLKEEIDARTDALMLERHGELATPEAIAREADKAIHNEARAKMVATEANALAKATGERKILAKAAKALAQTMVARIKVRDIKPTQYASAEARAAKNAEKAAKSGDLRTAAAEKRSQLVNTYATDAAYKAQDEINAGIRYLRKFEKDSARKGLDNDYLEQIDTLLERFDLRKGQSLKSIDKRTNLAAWIASQEQAGIEPQLPDYILAEANRTHYKNLTVEEFRGLVDSVKQIEHLGRLKKKLLTAKDERELEAIVEEIRQRIEQSSGGRQVDNEKRNTVQSQLSHFGRWVSSAHRKAASVVRELDGLTDGGPMWEYFTRSMNEAGNREATMRADAATRLHELAKPILTGEKMGGKGRFFPSLGRSLNRGERIAMALNWGNESNRQRLLGGKGWTVGQVQPVLDSLTSAEWTFVQGVWDFFESYRPEIAAKERRVYGKEPDWIEPAPFEITTADGKQMQIRGGYYPVKYDPNQSGKAGEFAEAEEAKAMMRAAYTAATTRRSFTKSRAEEVQGRPLLLTFDGIWQGANEVIHDLTWHEWLIDANRLLKRLDGAIRNGFGAEYVDVLRKAVKDVARGDTPASNMVERSLTHLRNGSSIVGMGWNLTTAVLQPLGLTNTAVRIGGKWLARGLSEFYGSPSKMVEVAEEVQSKSKFMANRALTMNREINDVRNKLESDKSEVRQRIEASFFIMIQKMQAGVDYPTWLGAYAKAISDPANINQDGTINEERAVALADQAVIDAQGNGQIKDLAEIQRGHPLLKLFTNFYSYFNVLMNLTTEQTKKRVRDKEYMGLAGDYLLLMVVPAVMSAIVRNALKGEDDEDKYAKDIAAELVGYPFGMFLGLREMAEAAKLATGLGNPGLGYSGPAGLRFFSEVNKLGQQIGQGELDMALFKALNNTAGLLFHYPAGQVNRAVEGAAALIDGKTDNPLAPLVGVQK